MNENPFYRLAPFIQEFIYREKWGSLHEVQAKAIPIILDTPYHVLIASPTASGKTEAALLPIITNLYENPPATVGAMYIGPLKALINDQFERLEGLLEDTDIPVQSWHGDVSQSKKKRFMRQAQGILQITPESLEAMFINRHHELSRLFAELRYVIIDEIHAFIDSDRGRQVMCQLERLSTVQNTPARRVGLSATLGEPELAMEWLTGNSGIPVELITGRRKSSVELGLEYFLLPADDDEDDDATIIESEEAASDTTRSDESELPTLAEDDAKDTTLSEAEEAAILADETAFYEHLHRMTQRVKKTLIFANSRGRTEDIVIQMRRLSKKKKLPSFYHVHHGSISAALREAAEEAMRDDTKPSSIAATLTLELGIDIGKLDQVLQIDSTFSVSSFVQRLGRSGRRTDPPRMFFYATETENNPDHIGKELPWNFLQTIAIIQLYVEEKWIEPPTIPKMPLSLLYHQTMSTITSHTELIPPELAQRILTLSPFQHITADHFRQLLRHLLEIEHLEQTEIGGLIIGVKAEKIVNHYRFYATFEDDVTYRVRDASREIGTIQSEPEVGSTIGLAGFAWRVLTVDRDKQIIFVQRAQGKVTTSWTGGGIRIHTRILHKMRQILFSDDSYPYLHVRATHRLQQARRLANKVGLHRTSILPLAPNRYMIFPWCGTRPFQTQIQLLSHANMRIAESYTPYYYEVVVNADDARMLQEQFDEIIAQPPTAHTLAATIDERALARHKYDRYIPSDLLREAYARDYLDILGGVASLKALS